jgi:lipoprotein-releasing system ATP-binding protein
MAGEGVALVGQSGTGKSTLLQIIALLEGPTSGEVIIDGIRTSELSDDAKTKIRRKNVGFVYQFHNLLPEFTVVENVMIPCIAAGVRRNEAKDRALALLHSVGLRPRIEYSPKRLSGGEQQRVAIARALANEPNLIIADEPTGNLDPATASLVFDLFIGLVRSKNAALLMATHNLELARRLDRSLMISNGVVRDFRGQDLSTLER